MVLTCPNCKKELVNKIINTIELDYCENGCKGIWFDDQELSKIRNAPSENINLEDIKGQFIPKTREEALKDQTRYCPRCNVELFRYNWDMKSNIFLDSCDKCGGIWLDEGELEGMKEYLLKMSQNPVPNENEIRLKLATIHHETSEKLDKDQDENINKLIDWDFFILDDALRFLVKKFSKE